MSKVFLQEYYNTLRTTEKITIETNSMLRNKNVSTQTQEIPTQTEVVPTPPSTPCPTQTSLLKKLRSLKKK